MMRDEIQGSSKITQGSLVVTRWSMPRVKEQRGMVLVLSLPIMIVLSILALVFPTKKAADRIDAFLLGIGHGPSLLSEGRLTHDPLLSILRYKPPTKVK